jgi:Uma2 family endonuclease
MENYDEEDLVLREPIAAYGKKVFTIEEYLEFENASSEKHEYYNGEIFAMAGASDDHCDIEGNLFAALKIALKKSPCKPRLSSKRIHIRSNTLFTYPDITVTCKNAMSDSERGELMPKVIIEVLSKSTRKYDRGKKFELYKDIPDFQEYILVDSQKFAIDIYRRTVQNKWELRQYTIKDSSIEIKTLNLKISFESIYYGTQLKVNNEFPSIEIDPYKGNIERA